MIWLALAVVAAVVNLVIAELAGWLPWVAEKTIRRAAHLLPPESRSRYEEEWLAELEVLPGSGISALLFSLRLLVRARRVGKELAGSPSAWPTALLRSAIARPLVDFALIWVGLLMALGIRPLTSDISSARVAILFFPLLVMVLLYLRGRHRARISPQILDGVASVVGAVSAAVMTLIAIGAFTNQDLATPHQWSSVWLFCLMALGAGRATLGVLQRWARARGFISRPVLIMGAGVVGEQVARRLENHPEYGLAPIGFLGEDPRSVVKVGGRDVPVLGKIEDLDAIVERTGVRNLIVAFSSVADARVSRLIRRCQELGIEVSVVPRMFDTINNRVGYDTVGGLPLMSFTTVDPRGVQFAIKQSLDRVLALALLVMLSPVILFSAFAVRLSSTGPVLFRQRRIGRDGKVFDLYKFRSMRIADGHVDPMDDDADPLEFPLPSGGVVDDRPTPIGRFLRRFSLDELPQLLNVLRGEMSFIGPRPERPEFVELFKQDVIRYGDRHKVKSGITGWAQVHGLRGQTSLAERVEWDNYYIANWSLGLDLKILALTIIMPFRSSK